MENRVYENYALLSRAAAGAIAGYIAARPGALICLAAGDTPHGCFRELIAMQRAGEVDLRSARYVSLDEWWGLGYFTRGSCAQVMRDHFYTPAGIPEDRMTLIDGLAGDMEAEKARVADEIARLGGVGLFLLGIGLNGHLGFLEPGPMPGGRVVDLPLSETTISVAPKYFGQPLPPLSRGVTVGLSEMLNAETVILLASGQKKAEIIRQTVRGPITQQVPSSLMRRRAGDTYLYLDREAAELL